MHESPYELSIVIPCLNEAESLPSTLSKVRKGLEKSGAHAEIIVADNGSTDGSQAVAESFGARVINVPRRGYGSALRAGIESARAPLIIMGDADDSYDFREIPRFLSMLREGFDLVQGCRLSAGGGTIMPGAMPWLHRVIGNPLFSRLAKLWYGTPIDDIHCGMRGFTKGFIEKLDLRCTDMEFAVEMIIKASLFKCRITQLPICLHPDKRRQGRRHLRTFHHGARALRFMLLCAPLWLFWFPGLALCALGLLGYAITLCDVNPFGIDLGVHTLLVSSLSIICGYQALVFSTVAQRFAETERLIAGGSRTLGVTQKALVEHGLIVALLLCVVGSVLIADIALPWAEHGFHPLEPEHTMRWVIPGVTLIALGVQSVFSQLLLSLLEVDRI